MTKYRVNRDHPAVRAVLDSPLAIDGSVDTMLSVLESTIPVQRIWLDTIEERTAPQQITQMRRPRESGQCLRLFTVPFYDGITLLRMLDNGCSERNRFRHIRSSFLSYPHWIQKVRSNMATPQELEQQVVKLAQLLLADAETGTVDSVRIDEAIAQALTMKPSWATGLESLGRQG